MSHYPCVKMISCQNIDPKFSKAAAKRFSIHLWYLASVTVTLFICDDNVPT